MLSTTTHDDVLRLELWSHLSRRFGYTVSAYLVRSVLVDTGSPAVARDVLGFLDEAARTGAAVRGAIVTHQHEDHSGNAEALARRGVPLLMSDATRVAVRAPAPLEAYRRLTWGMMAPLRTPTADFDPAPLVLVPTPGHSADHHVVWDPETRTVFGGDLFLSVKVRVAHASEDLQALSRSLRDVAALRPARLFDGHRGLVESPEGVLLAKAAWIDETVGEIVRRHSAGHSRRAIARTVLGPEPLTGFFSRGHYSHRAFVDAALRSGDA